MATISLADAAVLAKKNLLQIFGERDPQKRLEAMHSTYAPDITFYEPDNIVTGFGAIKDLVETLLSKSPDWVFEPAERIWVNHDMVTLEWGFGPDGKEAVVKGNDVMIVNGEGKVRVMCTMISGVSDLVLQ